MKHLFSIITLLILFLSFNGCKRISKKWDYNAQTNNLTADINPSGDVLMLEFDNYIRSLRPYHHSCRNYTNFKVISIEEIDTCSDAILTLYIEEYYGEVMDNLSEAEREEWERKLKMLMEESMEQIELSQNSVQDLSLVDDLYNNEDIKVNGKAYSGRIIGFHKETGKKMFEFDPGPIESRPLPGEIRIEMENSSHKKCITWDESGKKKTQRVYIEMQTRKPVIYLYPTKTEQIDLQLDIQHGDLTTTYPKYQKNKGWSVMAKPDGTLIDPRNQMEYYALYWEANSRYRYDMSKGFVVRGADCAVFLDKRLAELGLNRREANEFIIYWLPILEQNKYNLIHFSTNEYEAENRMQISPKPETLIRLLMVYSPLDKPIEMEPQQFEPIKRKGFTVVEWGGQEQHYDVQ